MQAAGPATGPLHVRRTSYSDARVIVELDPINVADLLAGSVVVYTPAEGAGVVAVLSIEGDPVAPDGTGQIGFATELLPQVFAQTSGGAAESFVQIIYNPFATDPIRAGLTFGSRLAEAWQAGHAYDGSALTVMLIGAGHYWTTSDVGVSGALEPDWSSAIGSTIDDNGITWEDSGALPSSGSITVALQVEGERSGITFDGATVDELFRILKIRTPTAEQTTSAERCLSTAYLEIVREIDFAADETVADLSADEVDLCTGVNLDRAADLWRHTESIPGVTGLLGDEGAIAAPPRYSWERYAQRLATVKRQWGIA